MSDTSRLFELLAADHRRRVLLLLCESDAVDVPEDLRTRAVRTHDRRPTQQVPERPRQRTTDADRLEIELIHTHLPKLEDAGLVEWDRDAGTVRRGVAFDSVEPALRVLVANSEKFPDALL